MNILLINPPLSPPQMANFPPTGLLYIATALKKEGYRVNCVDACNLSWEILKERIIEARPDIVGITCWTFGRVQVYKTSRIVRTCFPEAQIIIGGQHATFLPEQMFKAANADFVVLGEGDETIVELVRAIEGHGNFADIEGIAYKDHNHIRINQFRPLIADLDSLPLPNYDDINLDNYRGLPESGRRAAGIISSRGCPFACNYCSSAQFWKRTWRPRSAQSVLSEIEYLYDDLGVRALMMFDDNFVLKKDRAIEICKVIIERKLDLVWASTGSVRVVDREVLTWMKKAGCYLVQYGVESGSPKILKSINKGQTVEQIRNAFRWTKEVGMESYAYLFIGAPGETKETIHETATLMREIAPNQGPTSGILWILPGTKIYDLAKSQAIISDEAWIKSDDEWFYYTGEYMVTELKQLQMQLCKQLARNKGMLSLLNFLLRKYLKGIDLIYKPYNLFRLYKTRFRRFLTIKFSK